jgi:tetratricopeptide (TPR) repeat protein
MPQGGGYGTTAPIQAGTTTQSLLPQENFQLSDNGVAYVMDLISETVNQEQKRSYTTRPDGYYETYLGEYLQLPLERGQSLKLISPNYINSYELFLQGNTLFFRSIYQDNYRIGIYENNILIKEITVNNKLKYKFTESQIYDIILRNYNNRDLKRAQNAATLYRIAYPNGARSREITLELIELAALNGDRNLFNEEYNQLLKKYTLTNDEILRVIESQRRVTRGAFTINPRFLTFHAENYSYNNQLKNLILSKGKPSAQEIQFLEQFNIQNPSPELAEAIDNFKTGGHISHEMETENILSTSDTVVEEAILDDTLEAEFIAPTTEAMHQSIPSTSHLIPETGVATPKPTPVQPSVETDKSNFGEFQNNFSSGKDAFNQENYNEAIIFLERALNTKGNFNEKGDAAFYLGQSYSNLGNYKKAIEYYNRATNSARNRGEVLYNLGVAYNEVGNTNMSKQTLNQVKTEFPDTIWSRKSTIYLMKLN